MVPKLLLGLGLALASLLELLKALVGFCPSQNLPPILLSGCSAIKMGPL